MKSLIKILTIFSLIVSFGLTSFVATADYTYASDCPSNAMVNTDGKWVKINDEGEEVDLSETERDACQDSSKDLEGKVLRFVKILSTLVVVFAVGMIVYGGFKYIASQGDPKKAEEAKTQILYAGVGLFIVLAAFTILKLFVQASGGSM